MWSFLSKQLVCIQCTYKWNEIFFLSFLEWYNKTFTVYFMIEISCLVFQTTVTLYACTRVRKSYALIGNMEFWIKNIFFLFGSQIVFIPGYAILLLDLFQIFMPCLLGTLLESKCDEFFENICKLSWIELPMSDRKSLIIILASALKLRSISFGFMNLNFDSFVQVIYKI